ncbi:hypothetical protein EB810_14305 [Altererythrobacter sp. FM1]|nr:hypothetical protein EB810_14305 [Altererythrobacter sp. FM1]
MVRFSVWESGPGIYEGCGGVGKGGADAPRLDMGEPALGVLKRGGVAGSRDREFLGGREVGAFRHGGASWVARFVDRLG